MIPAPHPPGLRLFLDTADRAAWAEWLPVGAFHGVTTNPTLLERAGIPCTVESLSGLARDAFDLGAREVHLQVWGRSAEAMAAAGRALAAIDRRIVVKVPLTRDGARAASGLAADGVRVTLTGLYAAHQALTAAALGASYAAPYLGRMNDAGRDGRAEIAAMQAMIDRLESPMDVLAASLRAPEDLVALARAGVRTFTFAPALAEALLSDPLTTQAAEAFETAAAAMGAGVVR